MVKGHTFTLMERNMKGIGRMGNIMVMEHSLILMEENIQGNSSSCIFLNSNRKQLRQIIYIIISLLLLANGLTPAHDGLCT